MTYPTASVTAEIAQNEQKRLYSLSVSSANTYRQCARLYYNRVVLGWQDAAEAPWLAFGSKIDRLLEVVDTQGLEAALEAVNQEFLDVYDAADVAVLLTLWKMQYGDQPLAPIDLNAKPGNQYPFRVEFMGNEVTGYLNMTVAGKIDKVTLVDGEVGLMEGKTTSQAIAANSEYWKKLTSDPQIACYVWALSKELGRPVNWVWYQVIRRPSYAAHPAFKRTYVRKGQTFPFSIDEYRKNISVILNEELEKPLVARRKIHIDEERKKLFITEHAQVYQDIQTRRNNQAILEENGLASELAWPRNHYGCDMYGGCSFYGCCWENQSIEHCGKFVKREKK